MIKILYLKKMHSGANYPLIVKKPNKPAAQAAGADPSRATPPIGKITYSVKWP